MISGHTFSGKLLIIIKFIKYSLLISLFTICSCGEGTTVQEANETKRIYYPNGQLKELTTWENGVMYGPFEGYFANGNLNYKGKMNRGKKQGTVEYFDSASGKLIKYINYVVWADTPVSYPNEVIYFQDNGKDVDTNAPNLYYEIGVISDTIKLNDSFFYSIKLHHPYFNRHKVYVCNFDSTFHFIDDEFCGYSWMINNEFHFADIGTQLGENYIRGYIKSDSATNPNDTNNIGKHSVTFFEKKYYVIP